MTRSLWIPAVCTMFAFASVYATLNGAGGLEDISKDAPACTTGTSLAVATSPPMANEAELVLASLRDTYLQRWHTWEESRYQVLSRAAPRQQSPTSAEIVWSKKAIDPRDTFLLATISIRQREQTHTIPCVVDPTTKRVRLFHEGGWLTEDEWLKTAPSMPNETNRKVK
jgi:hypothetical protein